VLQDQRREVGSEPHAVGVAEAGPRDRAAGVDQQATLGEQRQEIVDVCRAQSHPRSQPVEPRAVEAPVERADQRMMTWGETNEHDGVGRVDAELRGRRAPAQPHEAREQGRPAQSRAAV